MHEDISHEDKEVDAKSEEEGDFKTSQRDNVRAREAKSVVAVAC